MTTDVGNLPQQLVAAWNTHDAGPILALFTEDLVYEDVTFGAVCHSREEARQFFADAFSTFPDLRFELTSGFTSGDHGAVEWTMTGTHEGDMPGMPATHKQFTVRGTSIFELRGDKIRQNRDYWDLVTVLRQLGLMPETAAG